MTEKPAATYRRRVFQPKHRRAKRNPGTRYSRWGHIASGLLLAIVTVSTVFAACAVTLFRIGFAPVLTNSMAPSLQAGSVVITRQIPTINLAVGDAVVLPLPDGDGQRYLHRIIEVDHGDGQTIIKTKGDHNPLPDPWTLEVTSSTTPAAVASIPYVGWTANVLRWTAVRLVLAGLIVGLVVVGLVRARRQLLDERDDDLEDTVPFSEV